MDKPQTTEYSEKEHEKPQAAFDRLENDQYNIDWLDELIVLIYQGRQDEAVELINKHK